jgi:hypothetical protein
MMAPILRIAFINQLNMITLAQYKQKKKQKHTGIDDGLLKLGIRQISTKEKQIKIKKTA